LSGKVVGSILINSFLVLGSACKSSAYL
jgi:hypothetical protein